jgi:hypothetical protein
LLRDNFFPGSTHASRAVRGASPRNIPVVSGRLARAPIATREAGALPRKFLAQTQPLSQALGQMNSSGRSQTGARVLIASILFAAFSWTLVVSISPRLHGYIHDDANRSDHVCAITLIASGSYEHASQPPLISAPQFDICCSETTSLSPTWVKPLFLSAHIFAHAPPAHS